MTVICKPVRVGKRTYLRIPKECEDLPSVVQGRTCTVDLQISEKGYCLVYTFAKPVPDPMEDGPRRPLWMERELVA